MTSQCSKLPLLWLLPLRLDVFGRQKQTWQWCFSSTQCEWSKVHWDKHFMKYNWGLSFFWWKFASLPLVVQVLGIDMPCEPQKLASYEPLLLLSLLTILHSWNYFSSMQSSQYAAVQNVIYYLFYHFHKKSSLDSIITH